MGNICRSPTAEGVVRRLWLDTAQDLLLEVDSAGTHDYHVGDPPDPRAIAAARRRGIDLSGLRARQLSASDLERFDLILAMDDENRRHVLALAGPASRAEVRLFLDYAPEQELREVPDPYYGGATGFERVLDLAEAAALGLLDELKRRARAA
jgi:protein-tyrosine phosphatase